VLILNSAVETLLFIEATTVSFGRGHDEFVFASSGGRRADRIQDGASSTTISTAIYDKRRLQKDPCCGGRGWEAVPYPSRPLFSITMITVMLLVDDDETT
jgi:hypothetical protein